MRTGAAHRLSPYLHPEDFLPTADGIVFKRELIFPDDRPAFFVPCVGHDVEVRRPHLKLTLPVDDGGERGTDQVRPFRVALLRETKPKLLPLCQEAEQLIAIPGTAVLTSLYREYKNTMVCTVFPSPISSARMQFFLQRWARAG